MRRSPLERGASALQYVGMIIVASLIVGSLAAAVVPAQLAAAVSRAICLVTGQTNCPATKGPTKPISDIWGSAVGGHAIGLNLWVG